MKKLPGPLFSAGVVAGLVLVGLIMSRHKGGQSQDELQVSASEASPAASVEAEPSPFFNKHAHKQASETSDNAVSAENSATRTNVIATWREKVDEVLGSTQPEADKAKQMLELFPRLPADGQEEVAQHLSNLLPDEDYGLLHPYLTDATLPEQVSDSLLDDALNRPNRLKLPALLEVARTAQHPKAAEAKDFLELLLDEDYGDNWDLWQTKVTQWLAENPD